MSPPLYTNVVDVVTVVVFLLCFEYHSYYLHNFYVLFSHLGISTMDESQQNNVCAYVHFMECKSTKYDATVVLKTLTIEKAKSTSI